MIGTGTGATLHLNKGFASDNPLQWLLFADATTVLTGAVSGLALGDLDGDRDLDLVVGHLRRARPVASRTPPASFAAAGRSAPAPARSRWSTSTATASSTSCSAPRSSATRGGADLRRRHVARHRHGHVDRRRRPRRRRLRGARPRHRQRARPAARQPRLRRAAAGSASRTASRSARPTWPRPPSSLANVDTDRDLDLLIGVNGGASLLARNDQVQVTRVAFSGVTVSLTASSGSADAVKIVDGQGAFVLVSGGVAGSFSGKADLAAGGFGLNASVAVRLNSTTQTFDETIEVGGVRLDIKFGAQRDRDTPGKPFVAFSGSGSDPDRRLRRDHRQPHEHRQRRLRHRQRVHRPGPGAPRRRHDQLERQGPAARRRLVRVPDDQRQDRDLRHRHRAAARDLRREHHRHGHGAASTTTAAPSR